MAHQLGTTDAFAFQAFAEKYILARAPSFEKGKELEDGWNALLAARTLWRHLGRASEMIMEEEARRQRTVQQAAVNIPPPSPSTLRELRRLHDELTHNSVVAGGGGGGMLGSVGPSLPHESYAWTGRLSPPPQKPKT